MANVVISHTAGDCPDSVLLITTTTQPCRIGTFCHSWCVSSAQPSQSCRTDAPANLRRHVASAEYVQQRISAGAFEQMSWDWDLHGM